MLIGAQCFGLHSNCFCRAEILAVEQKGALEVLETDSSGLGRNRVRRRRSDPAEDEMEHQISRDVQLQVWSLLVLAQARLFRSCFNQPTLSLRPSFCR